MTAMNNVAENYFGEEENEEIQYYEEAFPSLANNIQIENSKKSIQFSNDFAELSLLNVEKSIKSSVFTTDTFVIPFEERRFMEPDMGSSSRLKRLLTDICSNCGILVETNVTSDDSLRVFIRGPKVSVVEAKKRIMKLLQTQSQIEVDIPKEFHRYLIGTKGALRKDLENETNSEISIPKPNDNSTIIVIRGTKDNAEHAKQQIQKIVDELAKVSRQVVEVDKRFHQLVCHRSNTSLYVVVDRKQLRLSIPPLSVNKNEISISGDREGVTQAASILLQTYNSMRNTYQELQIEIPKEKHRFIIGPRGSGIKDILDKTGVWVEITDHKSSDSSENTVCLLGPKDNLGNALTMVFVKSESVHISNISAPGWLHKFIIGKNGSNLVEISSNKPDIHLSFETDLNQIVIEGPPEDVEEVTELVNKKVFDLQSRLSHTELEIDPAMIKHVVGSGGSNIQKIRSDTNCTIMFPRDPTKRVVTIVGKPGEVESAKAMLLKTIETIENTKKKDVIFRHDFLPQLIGQSGKGLKDIKEKYPDVRINFPPQDSDSDLITLIGPRKDVDEVAIFLQKKNISLVESNYSEKVSIPHKYHRTIIGREGITIRDLTKTTNTKFLFPAINEGKDEIIITGKKSDVQDAIKRVYNIYEKESNIIEVGIEIPKNLHTILIGKGGNRINTFKESCGGRVTVRFPTPESDSNTVVIKGIKDDVFKAQMKLHDLVEEITSSNYEEQFQLTAEEFEFLFMSPDLRFKKLREVYNVRISENEDKTVRISGQKENVVSVVQLLNNAKVVQGPIVTDNMSLSIDHVTYFQKSGELVRIGKTHLCKVIVPSTKKIKISSNTQGVLEFKGPEAHIQAAKAEIQQIVDDYENTVTEPLIVDENQLENLKRFSHNQLFEITEKYKVRIEIPLYPESNYYQDSSQTSSKTLDKGEMNGVDSSFSEEESFQSISPNPPHNMPHLPNGLTVGAHKHSDISDLNSEVSSTISTGINHINDSNSKIKLPKYRLLITGHKENIQLAKEEIIKLFVLDLEVDVPEEFYPPLIGTKGSKINELREKHQVNVLIPTKITKYKKVIVSGPSERAVAAKKEIVEFVAELEKLKEERLEKNFRATVNVPLEYHTQLIGPKGENISKLRNKYTVRINVPSLDNKSSEIVILGHRDNVEKAKRDVELFVHKLQNCVIEHLHIDSQLHSRLIGSRGASLDQLKKKYRVEIFFPTRGTEGDDANIVKVKGTKETVDQCADELIERANQMLEEIQEKQDKPQVSRFDPISVQCVPTPNHSRSSHGGPVGFQIRDAPWHQVPLQEPLDMSTDAPQVNPVPVQPTAWNQFRTKKSGGVRQ